MEKQELEDLIVSMARDMAVIKDSLNALLVNRLLDVVEDNLQEVSDGQEFQPAKYQGIKMRYNYGEGYFQKLERNEWIEGKDDGSETFYFCESGQDEEYIFIKDKNRSCYIALPRSGGKAYISQDDRHTWDFLYNLSLEKNK